MYSVQSRYTSRVRLIPLRMRRNVAAILQADLVSAARAPPLLCSSGDCGVSCLPSLSERMHAAQLTAQQRQSEIAAPAPMSSIDMRMQNAQGAADSLCAAARGPHPPSAPEHHHEPEGRRHVAQKPARLVDIDGLRSDLNQTCCEHKCLQSWDCADAMTFRMQISARNERERLEYLLHEILPHCAQLDSGRHIYKLQVHHSGQDRLYHVCRAAMLAILGISGGKLDHALRLQKLKLPVPEHGNTSKRESPAAVLCESWLAVYVKEFCDKVSEGKFELPGWLVFLCYRDSFSLGLH